MHAINNLATYNVHVFFSYVPTYVYCMYIILYIIYRKLFAHNLSQNSRHVAILLYILMYISSVLPMFFSVLYLMKTFVIHCDIWNAQHRY